MKIWRKSRNEKMKKQSSPQQKQRPKRQQIPVSEPWKPPIKIQVALEKSDEMPVAQTSKVFHPVNKEPISYRPSLRNDKHYQEFLGKFRQLLSSKHRPIDIWRDFIIMSACAMSNTVDKVHYVEREERYLEIINKYEKSQQQIFPQLYADLVMGLDENPEQDFLGEIFMELHLNCEELKQIFTPYHVCQLMTDLSMENIVEQVHRHGYISISDCCCGAGATLIAAVNYARRKLENSGLNFQNHILVIGQDIEELVALMCYIQISLLGVAGYVKVGNALTEPVASGGSMEDYWFTPMYFSDVWHTRRMINRFMDLFEKACK